jgi:hypothetical protein
MEKNNGFHHDSNPRTSGMSQKNPYNGYMKVQGTCNGNAKVAKFITRQNVYIDTTLDRLCSLLVRVPDYSPRSPGVDSRRYQIF